MRKEFKQATENYSKDIEDHLGDLLNKDWKGGPAPLGFSWKNSTDETDHTVHEIQLGHSQEK